MKIKRIVIFAAIISLILSLGSCSGKKSEKNEEGNKSSDTSFSSDNVSDTTYTASISDTYSTTEAEPEDTEIYPDGTVTVTFNEKHVKELNFGDYIKIKNYKGLSVEYNGESKETIADRVASLGENDFEPVTEGKVAKGDTVNLAFTCFIDGTENPEYKSEDYDWHIGNNELFDALKLDLIGINVGSLIKRDLTFPDDYFRTLYQGVKAQFEIKVNYIKKYTHPTVDDEYIKKYTNGEFLSVSDYVEYLYTQTVLDTVSDECFELAYEDVCKRSLSYDDELLTVLKDDMRESDKAIASELNIKPNEYYQLTESEYEDKLSENAKTYFVKTLLLYSIAYLENIPFTSDEEMNAYIEIKSAEIWMTPERFLEVYGESGIKETVFKQKVSRFLAETAVINNGNK